MADPPQIEEPIPISVEILAGILPNLNRRKATIKDVAIVNIMIGIDCFPVCSTTFKFIPNPSNITAYCKIFLEVNLMPALNFALSWIIIPAIIPKIIAITAPPTIGNL